MIYVAAFILADAILAAWFLRAIATCPEDTKLWRGGAGHD
jgi:hypothetical protein